MAKKDLEKVKREAAKKGVVITQLGSDWQQLMRVTEEAKLDEKQKAMVEHAKASKATLGVKIMVAPPPAVLEHALTRTSRMPTAPPRPPRSRSRFSDNTTFTIVRTSVDIKPDMCIWRGTVEGPDAQVTLMWWPNGKMTGTVQGEGTPNVDPPPRRPALRGGRDGRGPHAAGACGDAAAPARSDPSLRDDPLVKQGDASILRPKVTAATRPAA